MDYFDALRCDNKKATLSSDENGFTVLKTPRESFLFDSLDEPPEELPSELTEQGFSPSKVKTQDLDPPLNGVSKVILEESEEYKKAYWLLVFINHPTPKVKKTSFILACGSVDL